MQATVASTQQLSEVLAPLWAYLNRRSSADLFRMVAELDSSFSQVKMLFLLEDGGEHAVKEIAQHLGLSLPAASRAVDGLIQRGYVSRRESATDRRSRLVTLTDEGRAVVDRVLRARLQTLERFAAELTPKERDCLYSALLPIVERIASPVNNRLRLTDANRRWWTLGAMCFALAMVMLDNTVTNVALPSIQRSFDASLSALEWTVNAYTLSFAVLLVTGGRLGDILGRRKVFLVGVVIFAAASATIAAAPNEGWLVAFRAVQGVGAALMMPGTLSIITNAFPPQERGKAIGTWAGVSAIALAIGPLLGGWLTEDVTWRAIFIINVPVAIVAVIVTLFAAQESRDETATREIDVPGIATLTVGLTALVLALVESNAWGWGSARIIGLLAAAVIGLTAFVLIERRARAPIVDFSFFRARSFVGANVVAFTISFSMFAVFFFIALYMQNILGYSPLQTGVRFLPTTLVVMVAGPLAGRLSDRVGPRVPLVIGLSLVAVSLAWQSRLDVDTSFGFLFPAFVLLGAGMGFTMSPMSTAAMNAVDRTKAGVASGTLSMTRMVGSTFGVAAMGALVAAIGRNDLARSLPRVPHAARERLVEGLGSGAAPTGAGPRVRSAAAHAFVDAVGTGLTIAAAAMVLAAVAAWVLIAPGRPTAEVPVEAEAEAEAVAV